MMNAALINNRYRILKTLGRGGFGETYLAEDIHLPSARKCVLKQLKPIVEQPTIPLWMKERFQREAAILEELGAATPQIPELYAYFSEQEQFYLVQEWIEGETLAQKWQRQGNLTGQEITKILTQILPVLDFIHARKIVHRDIKPENIILRDGDFLPVLIDFGAVKEAMATTVQHNSNSAFSAAIGTPGYMPSEQAAGRPLYSSDLYSLGLTTIFLLTGKAPQELEIDPQTGEIIWQKYAKGVDRRLVGVLDRAIRFHPRDRFSQAREMLIALKPDFNLSQSHKVTRATVKVSPAVSNRSNNNNFAGTVAYKEDRSNQKFSNNNWLSKLLLFFLVSGGLAFGAFALGFYSLSNWWESRPQSSPQITEKPTEPEPIFLPPQEEPEKVKKEAETNFKIGDLIKIGELKKDKKDGEEQPEIVEETETSSENPENTEIVIQPKPEPEPEPKPSIIATGASENQLINTLGQPTSQRNEPRKNSKVLVYNNATSNNVNLTYHSDSNGSLKQADVALNQDLSLGAMQDTLAQLLGENAPIDAKNKLRDVYNRQANLQSFRVGNLQGQIQRDSKDRVSISVWESGY